MEVTLAPDEPRSRFMARRSPLLTALLSKASTSLANAGDLMRLSKRPAEDLRALKFDDKDIDAIGAFSAIGTVFSPNVALAILDKGITTLDDLLALNMDEFLGALKSAGISQEESIPEVARLRAWQRDPRGQPRPNGLTLDMGPSALSNEARKSLERAGVATLWDWVNARDSLKIPQKDADLIDAHTRLRGVGLWGGMPKRSLNLGSVPRRIWRGWMTIRQCRCP